MKSILLSISISGIFTILPMSARADMYKAKQIATKAFAGQYDEAFGQAQKQYKSEAYLGWMTLALADHMTGRMDQKSKALHELTQVMEQNSYQANPHPLQVALDFDEASKTKDFSSALWPDCVQAVKEPYYHADLQLQDVLDAANIALKRSEKQIALDLLQIVPALLAKADPNRISRSNIASWVAALYQKAGDSQQMERWLKDAKDKSSALKNGQMAINRHAVNFSNAISISPDQSMVTVATAISHGHMDVAKSALAKAVEGVIANPPADYADENDWGLESFITDVLENSSEMTLKRSIELVETEVLPHIKSQDVLNEVRSYIELKRSDPVKGTKLLQLMKLTDSEVGMYR